TPAEGDLLRLVARGLANKEIARELGIANQTVQNGLTRVFQKLGVKTDCAVGMRVNAGRRCLPASVLRWFRRTVVRGSWCGD
ncbi:helix-turn-helix domain-containing protein, partial [Deinococcus multiflagellatus]